MADWTLTSLQLRGKARRFVQANLSRQNHEALLARRDGACKRCGECCRLAFRCPFLGTDAEGRTGCRIYGLRFTQCRLFPLHAADLREVRGECGYRFSTDASTVPPATAARSPEQPRVSED